MYTWQYGDLMNTQIVDSRYAERRLMVNGDALFYANTFSARDLSLFYYRLATAGKTRRYYEIAIEMLSLRPQNVSKNETPNAAAKPTRPATKGGSFSPRRPPSPRAPATNQA